MLTRISRKRRKNQDTLDQSSVSFATAATCYKNARCPKESLAASEKSLQRKRDFVLIA